MSIPKNIIDNFQFGSKTFSNGLFAGKEIVPIRDRSLKFYAELSSEKIQWKERKLLTDTITYIAQVYKSGMYTSRQIIFSDYFDHKSIKVYSLHVYKRGGKGINEDIIIIIFDQILITTFWSFFCAILEFSHDHR